MELTGVDSGPLDSSDLTLSLWVNYSQPIFALVHSPRSYFKAMLTFIDKEDLSIDSMHNMGSIYWPSTLRQVSLGYILHARVDWMALPISLERLTLGGLSLIHI